MKKEISTKDLFDFVISVTLVYTVFGVIRLIYPDFLSGIAILFNNLWVNNVYYVITSALLFFFFIWEKDKWSLCRDGKSKLFGFCKAIY